MIYTIYGRPDGAPHSLDADQLDRLKAVPESLATAALIAPPIWLIAYRLWWPLAFSLLYWGFCLALLATAFSVVTPFIIGLPGLYLMLEGRELYRRKLESQGLMMLDLVDATSESAAIGRFIAQQQDSDRPPAVAPPRKLVDQLPELPGGSEETEPVFGLFSPRGS